MVYNTRFYRDIKERSLNEIQNTKIRGKGQTKKTHIYQTKKAYNKTETYMY